MTEYKVEIVSSAIVDFYIPKWRKDKSFLLFKWKTKWDVFRNSSAYGVEVFTDEDTLNKFLKENNIDFKLQERRLKLNKLK
jgi:hypothetical protein